MNAETESKQEQSPSTVPEYLRPDRVDRTLEGYVQLLQDLQLTQRALNQEFKSILTGDPESVAALREQAAAHIDEINANRPENTRVDIKNVNPNFLAGLVQPNWSEKFPPLDPKDEKEAANNEKEWEKFKESFGSISMEINLDAMRILHAKVAQLENDEALQAEFREHQGEKLEVLRVAATMRVAERKQKKLSRLITQIHMNAAESGRASLTPAEKMAIQRIQAQMDQCDEAWKPLITSEELIKATQPVRRKAEFVDAKRQLDKGLLMTDQMENIIREALPAAKRGEPLLFVGHTGGAKTALAEFLASEYFDEPELISGYADANSYQMLGKQELRAKSAAEVVDFDDVKEKLKDMGVNWDEVSEDKKVDLITQGWKDLHLPGSTESVFVPGPVLRAMEDGRPLILDEVNAMDPGLLKRFNKILQLRPGDRFSVQEDSGREVIIKRGFFIAMTMNEKSKVYKGVDDLSVEFMNRIGANDYRVLYPDEGNRYSDMPKDNIRLIYAALCDEHGELPAELDGNDLMNFVKASFVSQQIFTGKHGEGLDEFTETDGIVDEGKPGLEETVLAPRTMVDIARKVAGSYGEITFDMALRRFIDGIKNQNDRKVLDAILKGHGFFKPPEKSESESELLPESEVPSSQSRQFQP